MLEVFTVGGGEYLVNIFNAVAAWSGGGGYRSLIRVVMVMGLIYSLLVVAFTLNWKAWMNWFLQATAIYLCLMVPTIDIKVTDRINPSLAPATVDNVPLGLGVLASFTTQIGDWLTRTAETVFVMPSELNYSTNGMVYGARLFDGRRGLLYRGNQHLKIRIALREQRYESALQLRRDLAERDNDRKRRQIIHRPRRRSRPRGC